MTDVDDDPVFARLRALPAARLDDVAVERVRRRAQAALAAERSMSRRVVRAAATALVASTVATYLALLIHACANLYG